jgi:2-haloacid dehalogenase
VNEAAPWATFDCYGTLVDWVTGMRRAVESFGVDDPERLLGAYYRLELEVEQEQPGTRYREILAETLRRAAARERIALPPDGEHVLARGWDDLPVFGDTVPALQALRSDGWRLAILTNCDNDLIARTVEIIGVEFDVVVTAEDVGSYKPDHGHWRRFAARTDGQRSFWAHVACSWVHDIEPARALHLPAVWVDRDRTGHDPSIASAVLADLTLLPETLHGLRTGA